MASDREVEAAQTVSGKTVCSALQKDGLGPEVLNDLGYDWLEDHLEGLVVKPLVQRKVDCVVGAQIFADIIDVASAREIILELMEGAGHDPIGEIEGLLNTISVVDIDVNVQHSLVSLEQLQNGKYAVVDIAKPRGLRLLGVMQSSRPVDPVGEFSLPQQGSSG